MRSFSRGMGSFAGLGILCGLIGTAGYANATGRNAAVGAGPRLSPMGAKARKALHKLIPNAVVVAPSARPAQPPQDKSGTGDFDDDDEGGGPGELDDGGELPGGNQGELSLAVDDSGQHVVVGFNDFRGFRSNPLSVSGFMWSDDGGKTFHDGGQLPVTATGAIGTTLLPEVLGDPDVKYLGDCNFIYTSILIAPFGTGSAAQTMGFHRSRDCGHTWEGPFEIPPATNPNGVVIGGDPVDAADKELIGVDRTSGRVLFSWTNFSFDVEISSTFSDNVLDAQPTWSPRVIVGGRPGDGQASIPRFGPAGTDTAYIAWESFTADGFTTESFARSNDRGMTFSTPIDLDPGFFPNDYILGNDRIHSFPSMAVDRSRGRNRGNIYVTYAQNNSQDGADVVVQRSTNGGKSFGDPVFVGSRPGADRSQWFPWVATDDRTGRVHVIYYDQSPSDSGDLMQMSYTFSDDGVHWVKPRRLSPKTFHGGWGNDSSQPNLGDYNQAVVSTQGDLLAAYAITHPVGFRDGQPQLSMTVPEPTVSIAARGEQAPTTSLDFRGATATEIRGLSNSNGFLDPGETAAVALQVRNFVTNPINAAPVIGAFAVVTSSTPGVRVLLPVTTFPRANPGQTVTSQFPLLVNLDRRAFVPGSDIVLAIRIFSLSGLPVDLEATIHTGTPVETVLVSESFNEVAPGQIPAGWTAAHGASDTVVPWTTSNSFCGTTSNAAFHVNANDGSDPNNNARWERLFSPAFVVPADANFVDVEFDVCTDTEDDPNFNVLAYDGLFLRVFDGTAGDTARSVLAEAFETDFTTDGFNGYPKHFPRNSNPFYFEDMSVWAGDSGGLHHVKMRLPGMAGATAQLRFEFAQDDFSTCADVRPGHACGVLVDNVVVKAVKAR